MATDYGTTLRALDDLPEIGATVAGSLAGAYRVARRLLQPAGGLDDVIEPEDGVDWPESNHVSLDLREYLGRDLGAQELAELRALIVGAVREDEVVQAADVSVSYASGTLTVEVDVDGTEGPLSFVLSISDVDSVTLRAL